MPANRPHACIENRATITRIMTWPTGRRADIAGCCNSRYRLYAPSDSEKWQEIIKPMHKPKICNPNITGMESFASFQCASYILSCCSMIMYFLHFCAGFPSGIRVRFHNWFELLLLFVRGINEYFHKKLDRNDVLHHSAFIVGSLIVFNVPECARFGFLLSHMQCLHFPMVLWYTGCRRTDPRAKLNAGTQIFCEMSFPPTWIFCVAYRHNHALFDRLFGRSGTFIMHCRALPDFHRHDEY